MTIIPKKALIRCLMGCHDFFGVHQTNWKLANVRGKWQNSDLIWISIQVSSQNLSAMHVVITGKEVSEWDSQSGDSNCVSPDATTVGSNGNHSPSLRHHLRQLRGPHRFEGSDVKRHQSSVSLTSKEQNETDIKWVGFIFGPPQSSDHSFSKTCQWQPLTLSLTDWSEARKPVSDN